MPGSSPNISSDSFLGAERHHNDSNFYVRYGSHVKTESSIKKPLSH